MGKTFFFLLAIAAIVVIAFLYLNDQPPERPSSFDDATVADRCAEFREVDEEDEDIYSLGYKGRIRQLLHGCF